jgi:GNAT superfamily N-acetyltransferase
MTRTWPTSTKLDPRTKAAISTGPAYQFKPLVETCQRGAFSCGVREIDNWFRKNAWDQHRSRRSRVSTVHDAADDALVGFYAFCITLEDERLLDKHSHLKRLSIGRYFPTLQMHYLAVQKERQGNGIGTIIMGRIIDTFKDAAETLGLPAMTLVAINPRAAQLYTRLWFVSYGGPGSSRMLLPAQSVLDL